MRHGNGRADSLITRGDDRMDDHLLKEISKYIVYDHLGALARDLGITEDQINYISMTSRPLVDQAYQVSIH